jgi:hypothetical protein
MRVGPQANACRERCNKPTRIIQTQRWGCAQSVADSNDSYIPFWPNRLLPIASKRVATTKGIGQRL